MSVSKSIPLLLLLVLAALPPHAGAARLQDSVVKIYSVSNRPDFYSPWKMKGQRPSTGSGAIIEGGRILTNAHVVANQTFLQVKRAGQARKFVARVAAVSHEADLAVLEVEDPLFFEDTEPLRLGKLPRIQDKVAVYGFPQGGTKIAITEGVVSRVENLSYSHSGAWLLCCQIDASINPGSSGGPVINNGRIVGVAFQGGGGENIGYVVPPPVIRHFLEDIEDGAFQGTPTLALGYQKLENPELRARYDVPEERSGVLVTEVYKGSPAADILQAEDILLRIGEYDIANDATVEFRPGERTDLSYALQEKFIGETIELELWREAGALSVEVPLNLQMNKWQPVPRRAYDVTPEYFIVAGLVFTPLTANLLQEWGGAARAPRHLAEFYFDNELEDREEVVVLLQILSDRINVGYDQLPHSVVREANGEKVRNLAHLEELLADRDGEFLEIVTERDSRIVLRSEELDEANRRILERYRVPAARSQDLAGRIAQ